ncbi:MAG: hypothetical protein JWM10_4056 [Myxococcaceae bacterium]|nr:hypothetical protein [Myxococcaceae bacterium]
MSVRRPRTAAQSNALPSLAALLASGVAVEGCDTPAETAGRLQRLTAHGEQAGRALDGAQHGRAAREVAIGLGLLAEPDETRIHSAGEAPVVNTEPPIETAGTPTPIQLTPPPQHDPRVDVDGGISSVDPTPPPPPTPPRPRQPHPQPHVRPPGGIGMVRPQPQVRGGVSAVQPGAVTDPES